MLSWDKAYKGLEDTICAVALLNESCEGISLAWPEAKVSRLWFEGVAKVLGEVKVKLEDALEFVSDHEETEKSE